MIELNNVSKAYGETEVLQDVNIKIKKGDCTAIIGMNGSGKTTLVNLIVGTIKPTSGTIEHQFSLADFGLQIQDVIFNPYLKVSDYIKLQQDLYQIPDETVKEMIKLLNLNEMQNMKIKKLSGGQKQRLNILLAIIHNPEVIIFDELTTGLDALSRYEVREVLKNLNKMGKTILIISHYMDEVEDLCNKIICIKNGKISDYDQINNIKTKYEVESLDVYFKNKMLGVNHENK